MICPKCVSHNPEQAESCHWCGNVLRQEQEASSAETVVACVACGNELNPTANFCSRCGVARLTLREPAAVNPYLFCTVCSGSINPESNFCKWCGIAVANPPGRANPVSGKVPRILSSVVALADGVVEGKTQRERRRIAVAQRKKLLVEKSAARKEEQRLQKEAAYAAAQEAAKIAAAEKKERRAQKEAEQEAARKEASRRERERAPVKSGNSDSSDLEPFLMIIEIVVIPAIIQYIKTHPNGKLDVKQIAVKNGIPSTAVPFLTKMLTDYLKQKGMKPPW